MLKNSKFVYFCHLKQLVRPETVGPYYVCLFYVVPAVPPASNRTEPPNKPQPSAPVRHTSQYYS